MTALPPMLSVRGLQLALGEASRPRRVLHGVHFDVARGEAFGLVGESGSGKTSILRCVAGQYRQWQGNILLSGMPIDAARRAEHARRVQMVFQDPYGALHPRQTVGMALAEPLRVQGMRDVDAHIAQALQHVGLSPDFRLRYPHEISGGQRQRVAIARALVLKPPLLLLDEPTSALDVSVQAEVLNLLADLRQAHQLTYVLVSHDLGVVAHLCDRIAVMQGGRIVETLDVAALEAGAAQHRYTQALLSASPP